MPELPEVETVARHLRKTIVGKKLEGIRILDVRFADVQEKHDLVGRRVKTVKRRGKYLSLKLDDGWVLQLHMMMSGRILVRPREWQEDRFARLILLFEDGLELRFCDMRRFGRAWQLNELEHRKFHKRMGPEPLSATFTTVKMLKIMEGRSTALKTTLLNQNVIAGIGNIYADEALWRGRLHPLRPAGAITMAEGARLYRGIRTALREGLKAGGTTFSDYRNAEGVKGNYQLQLKVFQRTGQECFRCRNLIQRIRVGGRSTHFCPVCQPRTVNPSG